MPAFKTQRPGTYYRRHRRLPVIDEAGAVVGEVDALVTRYGTRAGRYHRAADAYYSGGTWYFIASVPTAGDEAGEATAWIHAFRPIGHDGRAVSLVNRYEADAARRGDVPPALTLTVSGGRLITAEAEGYGVLYEGDEGDGYAEALLGLNATKRKSPRKPAEAA